MKRLSMFVMRAKLKLSDASSEFDIYGLLGNAVDTIEKIAPQAINTPATGQFDTQTWIKLRPALSRNRALLLAPASSTAPAGETISNELWQWLDVMAGIAHISTPIVEAFVPQMLNYESVEGVNFKKGCYPGQEVVARSQFRGTLKRRAYIVQIDDDKSQAAVGQEIFHSSL